MDALQLCTKIVSTSSTIFFSCNSFVFHNFNLQFFPNIVSLGSSAIVKVPEQVEAAKSARRKIGNRVPGEGLLFQENPSEQPNPHGGGWEPGSQEEVPKQGSQEEVPKQGFQARFPGTGSQVMFPRGSHSQQEDPRNRFPSKVPRKRFAARFSSKVPRQGYQEQIPKQRFPARGSQAGFPGRGYQEEGFQEEVPRQGSQEVPSKVPCSFARASGIFATVLQTLLENRFSYSVCAVIAPCTPDL